MNLPEPEEVPLPGGIANRGLVVRVGNTVRRPQRPTSPATQALLGHLAQVGFDGAPRFLGIDDRGREVLSFVPGHAITWPYPAWALTEAALHSVAALLGRYHQAVASFDPAPYEWPARPPEPFRGALVSHNDPNLDNIVFRDERAVALIDFDLASPGSRLWDVAIAARLWSPLRSHADILDDRLGSSLRRFAVFARACGVRPEEHDLLVEAVRQSHSWVYEIVRAGGENGGRGYADYWASGGAERAERSERWLTASAELLRAALAH